eukprot:s1820_g4.t1
MTLSTKLWPLLVELGDQVGMIQDVIQCHALTLEEFQKMKMKVMVKEGSDEPEASMTPYEIELMRQESGGFRPRKRAVAQTGKSTAWTPQRAAKREWGSSTTAASTWTAGHWKGRGAASHEQGESIHHSSKNPNLSWQMILGKGLRPRSLWMGSQGGKGRQSAPVLDGSGGGASEPFNIRRSQARVKASQAIRDLEAAVALGGGGERCQLSWTPRPQLSPQWKRDPMNLLPIMEDRKLVFQWGQEPWFLHHQGLQKSLEQPRAHRQQLQRRRSSTPRRARASAKANFQMEKLKVKMERKKIWKGMSLSRHLHPQDTSSPTRILTDPKNQRIAEAIWSGRFGWGDINEAEWEDGDPEATSSLTTIHEAEDHGEEHPESEEPLPALTVATSSGPTTAATFSTGGSTTAHASEITNVTGPSTMPIPEGEGISEEEGIGGDGSGIPLAVQHEWRGLANIQ